MSERRILLTNDDGIDTVGFQATYDALSEIGDVVAVAPASDQSSVGRSMSHDVDVREHEFGYAIEGTPADCAIVGISDLCPDADLLVSGCNEGANLGAYVLGRSGTVSAAVESAFFDVPAIALSLYVPGGDDWWKRDFEPEQFRNATVAGVFLAEHAIEAGVFESAEYLNVNAPMYEGGSLSSMEVTRPSTLYDMDAERDGAEITIHDRIWERMRHDEIPDPEGTDRRAIVEDRISVSPLTAPHTTEHHEALDGLVEGYEP